MNYFITLPASDNTENNYVTIYTFPNEKEFYLKLLQICDGPQLNRLEHYPLLRRGALGSSAAGGGTLGRRWRPRGIPGGTSLHILAVSIMVKLGQLYSFRSFRLNFCVASSVSPHNSSQAKSEAVSADVRVYSIQRMTHYDLILFLFLSYQNFK